MPQDYRRAGGGHEGLASLTTRSNPDPLSSEWNLSWEDASIRKLGNQLTICCKLCSNVQVK